MQNRTLRVTLKRPDGREKSATAESPVHAANLVINFTRSFFDGAPAGTTVTVQEIEPQDWPTWDLTRA